jgi:hypothetical protein
MDWPAHSTCVRRAMFANAATLAMAICTSGSLTVHLGVHRLGADILTPYRFKVHRINCLHEVAVWLETRPTPNTLAQSTCLGMWRGSHIHGRCPCSSATKGRQKWCQERTPKHTLEAHPKHTLEAHPKHTLEAHPKHTLEAHPKHTLKAHPKHTLEAHPVTIPEGVFQHFEP